MKKAKSQTFKCEICDQVLKTKDKLQRHFDVTCDSCSKSFAFRQSLNLHKNNSRNAHNYFGLVSFGFWGFVPNLTGLFFLYVVINYI